MLQEMSMVRIGLGSGTRSETNFSGSFGIRVDTMLSFDLATVLGINYIRLVSFSIDARALDSQHQMIALTGFARHQSVTGRNHNLSATINWVDEIRNFNVRPGTTPVSLSLFQNTWFNNFIRVENIPMFNGLAGMNLTVEFISRTTPTRLNLYIRTH